MNNKDDFSLEQSEELIANLNSAEPSEFQQLQSVLNLLGHVAALPATSTPPVLPSEIAQPMPLLPVRSAKSHRTFVTSIIVAGFLTSASLAAAAVTGIGPTPIVNMGHETAKLVRGVADAVSHVVTGGSVITTKVISPHPQIPGLTPAPTGGDEGSSNASAGDQSHSSEDFIPGLPSPLTSEVKKTEDGKSGESGKSNSSHESQTPKVHEDGKSNSSHESQTPKVQENQTPQPEEIPSATPSAIAFPSASPTRTKEHIESDKHKTPESSRTRTLPTALPSANSTENSSDDD